MFSVHFRSTGFAVVSHLIPSVSRFHSHIKSDGIGKILCAFSQDCHWIKSGFRTLCIITVILKTYAFFKLCSFLLRMKFYVPNVWTYLFVVLPITVLLLIGTCHINANFLDFNGDVFIPNCFVVLCKTYDALCKSSSGADKSTWSSAKNRVLSTVPSFVQISFE
jgi:hypothetical protein